MALTPVNVNMVQAPIVQISQEVQDPNHVSVHIEEKDDPSDRLRSLIACAKQTLNR